MGHDPLRSSKGRVGGFAGSGPRAPIADASGLGASAARQRLRGLQKLEGDASKRVGDGQNIPLDEQ
eukprot:7531720-Pyramimonas_sp.AAC.1